jgi:sterol desaturase/sphingolipid hydroxylase (fatty acid hydroxylase superfamily)
VNWVVNTFVTLGLMVVGNYKDRKFRHDYNGIPSYFELAWQIAFCMIAEDMSFYWVHRALHHPKLYFLHKKHHEFYNTISIAAEY